MNKEGRINPRHIQDSTYLNFPQKLPGMVVILASHFCKITTAKIKIKLK